MKKNMILGLVLVFLAVLVVPCFGSGSQAAGESTSSNVNLTGLPIVKNKITLSYFVAIQPRTIMTRSNWNEFEIYQKLEQLTNIHIDFIHPPVGQERQQYNLILASQNLPDILYIQKGWVPPAVLLEDGNILKLNDLMAKHAPTWTALMNKSQLVSKQSKLDDGTLYMFPTLSGGSLERGPTTNGPFIRKDWLDRTGLPVPVTMDDWYKMLTAFKKLDPKYIPFVPQGLDILSRFASPYGVVMRGFFHENNVVKFSPIDPRFREFLVTMERWYREGLIDPDFAALNNDMMDAKMGGGIGGVTSGQLAGNLGRYMGTLAIADPKAVLLGVPYPAAADGKIYGYAPENLTPVVGRGASITSKNKNVIESVRWLDYHYSDTATMMFNFGIEGLTYNMVNGNPVFNDHIYKNPDGLTYDVALGKYTMLAGIDTAMVQDPRSFAQNSTPSETQRNAHAIWSTASTEKLMPPVDLTPAEATQFTNIMNAINTYVGENVVKFIMGQEPIANFDKFVSAIKSMNIDGAIKIQQDALNRYNKR